MKYALLFLLSISVSASLAQTKDYTSDTSTPDAIISALYGVISGAPGTPRDWDRFKYLFKPEARLIPTRKSDAGELIIRAMTPDEYVQLFSTRIATGFYEKELHRVTESYGTIMHVFSTYETKEKTDGPVTNRGINSIQLFFDGKRYYIVTIYWCAESMGYPLPEKYLDK